MQSMYWRASDPTVKCREVPLDSRQNLATHLRADLEELWQCLRHRRSDREIGVCDDLKAFQRTVDFCVGAIERNPSKLHLRHARGLRKSVENKAESRFGAHQRCRSELLGPEIVISKDFIGNNG